MVVAASCYQDGFLQYSEVKLVRANGKMNGAKYRAILEENLLDAARDFQMMRQNVKKFKYECFCKTS